MIKQQPSCLLAHTVTRLPFLPSKIESRFLGLQVFVVALVTQRFSRTADFKLEHALHDSTESRWRAQTADYPSPVQIQSCAVLGDFNKERAPAWPP